MRPVPIQPSQTPPEHLEQAAQRSRPGTTLSPAQWLKQHILAQEDESVSLGELLLPTLLGAMEACWIDAALIGLTAVGLLGFSTPLLPLWAPFVYITGFHWTLVFLERRSTGFREETATESKDDKHAQASAARHDMPIFFLILAVLSLFIIWLQIYAPTKPLYDLTWLASLVSDALFLNIHFYQAFFIVAFSCYLCWRGLRQLNRSVEPSHVIRGLLPGLGIIIVAILLRAAIESSGAPAPYTGFLFLLMPLFLFFSLTAHALARIVFERKWHSNALQGSVVAQERAVMTVISLLGVVFLLVTLLVGSFADPAFFGGALRILVPIGEAISVAYNWIIGIFADILVILVTPIFWLITFLGSLFPHTKPGVLPQPNKGGQSNPITHTTSAVPADWLPFLRLGALLLLLLLLFCLIWLALRRRHRKVVRVERKDGDIHESLWSWLLLWHQVQDMLRALFGRFLHRATAAVELPQAAPEALPADPAARDIRELYRALLKKAALRGYPRKKYETPLELRQRLDEGVPLVEPQLASITEAYLMVRYGGSLPDTDDIIEVREQWKELDQKWD